MIDAKTSPKWAHDCEFDKFLGQMEDKDRVVDLYLACGNHIIPLVVERWGDGVHDNWVGGIVRLMERHQS
jgi:hypothetical protein